MRGRVGRKFNILDLMVLVAATAVGSATALGYRDAVLTKLYRPRGYYLHDKIEVGAAFLGSFSVALMVLRLIPPRPRWRRIVRQPGAVASLSASLVLLLGLPVALVASWRQGPTGGAYMSWVVLLGWVAKEIGASIAAAWAIAATCGHWRPEPTWIDRAGRALGMAWITHYLIASVLAALII